MSTADPWGETLPRRLGLWSAVAVLVGSTIGSGIFRTPAVVAVRIGDAPTVLLAWVLGGVVALCGALTYAELSAAYPRSGGLYVFLREAFGPRVAFAFGWAELAVIRPGAYGAIATTAAAYGLRGLGWDPAAPVGPMALEQAVGAGLIATVAVVNALGVHRGAALQNLSTALKLGALLALVAVGVGFGRGLGVDLFAQRGAPGASAVLLAMVSISWAYDGWADLSFVGGEVADPQRTLPKALLLGTTLVVATYLAVNLVYLHLVPLEQMARTDLVAADAATAVLGPWGGTAVALTIAVSTFGTLNGSMMTAPRIFFAMAEDGLLPKRIGAVDPRTGAPIGAIALCAALGVVFVSVRSFTELADQFVIGIWPFYALGVLGVFALRRRSGPPATYRTWGYPWVPAAFLVVSVAMLVNVAWSDPVAVAVDLGVVGLALPLYAWVTRRR